VLDVLARKVVGWAMSEHSDAAWVPHALVMALGRRQPPVGWGHQAERGSQYACPADQHLLAPYGICGRMRCKGECRENAVGERCLGSLTREWTGHCQYATRHATQSDVIADIAMFYNSSRKHSYLGDISPKEYEALARVAELSVYFPLTTTDNAVAERFFGSLKGERTAQRHYATRQEARDDVVEYIEMFYNSTRLHSYLGYVSPNEYEGLAQVS
jgi:putative transposase